MCPNLEMLRIGTTTEGRREREGNVLKFDICVRIWKCYAQGRPPTGLPKYFIWHSQRTDSYISQYIYRKRYVPKPYENCKYVPYLKVKNYRPISLLSNLSKIFARVMQNRTSYFLEKYDTMYKFKFCSQRQFSTSHIQLSIAEIIRKLMDNKECSCNAFRRPRESF